MRVPPDQSFTTARTRMSATSIGRPMNGRVILVSRVENTNTSTARRRRAIACTKSSSIRVYGSMEPLTSHSTTRGRGARRRSRRGITIGSPPSRALTRSSRRGSTTPPLPGIQRRVTRTPGVHARRATTARARAISCGVVCREVLLPQQVVRAVRPDGVGRLLRGLAAALFRRHRRGRQPLNLRHATARRLNRLGQARATRLRPDAPEPIEYAIEPRQVMAAGDEHRPQCIAHVIPALESHMFQRAHGVERAAGAHGNTLRPEGPHEQHHVLGEMHHGAFESARSLARVTSAATRAPRIDSMSS